VTQPCSGALNRAPHEQPKHHNDDERRRRDNDHDRGQIGSDNHSRQCAHTESQHATTGSSPQHPQQLLTLPAYRLAPLVLATIHLHVLHHTLDPLGIVLAALVVAVGVVLVSLLIAQLVRRRAPN